MLVRGVKRVIFQERPGSAIVYDNQDIDLLVFRQQSIDRIMMFLAVKRKWIDCDFSEFDINN